VRSQPLTCATQELATKLLEPEHTLACGDCQTMRHLDDVMSADTRRKPIETKAIVIGPVASLNRCQRRTAALVIGSENPFRLTGLSPFRNGIS
jgi:hypothetical protein